jgi:hypothetical protein
MFGMIALSLYRALRLSGRPTIPAEAPTAGLWTLGPLSTISSGNNFQLRYYFPFYALLQARSMTTRNLAILNTQRGHRPRLQKDQPF